jgi:Predicted membrane protein
MGKRKWAKEEIEVYRKKHCTIFYWNKEDSNFLVPKAYGIGMTVNWANPITWIIIFAIIILIVIRKFL